MKPAFLVVCSFLASVCAAFATPLPDAVREADVDLAASQILRGSTVEPLDAGALRILLGLGETVGTPARARGGRVVKPEENAQYLLVFKRPVAIGTVLGAQGELRWHKAGAPLPPNPANPSDWLAAEVTSAQSEPRFAPLPQGAQTRAILAVIPARKEGPYLRLLSPRLTNHTPDATANADTEYTTEPTASPPYTHDAGHITRGRGAWINSGKNGKGLNVRPPITDVSPAWLVLSWPERRRVDGVILQDNFDKFELQTFEGPAGINAAAATEQEWKTVKKLQAATVDGQRWLTFPGVETRALRLRITKVSGTEPAVAKLSGFHVFADLGAQPVPPITHRIQEEAPVKIPYDLAQAGQVTLVVDGPDGTRVRNVIANVTQATGANAVAWDLRDESGGYVAPGKYRWKAITHPPLDVRYEMTAYPNVTSYFPERPAWLTGPDGAGGWMADHTPPRTACSTGDRVFLGSPVAESGVSLIECDLEGRKLWGHHSFEGFTGCEMLATDGKTLFNTMTATNFAARAGIDKTTDAIWAVDLETRKVRTLAMLQPTAERKRGIQGFAARDNKLYVAVHAPENWLNNAVAAVDVDPVNCLPAYPQARPARAAHEIVPDPRTDFIRLFRLKDTPPGQKYVWLDTTKNAEKRQHIVLALTKPVAIGSLVFPAPAREDKVQFQVSVLKPGAPYPPRPDEKADWQVVPMPDKSAWNVMALPPGTVTRAVKFTFLRGGAGAGDDLLAEVEEKKGGPSLDKVIGATAAPTAGLGSETGGWQRRLEGVKLLGRRFENLFGTATVRVNSGQVTPDGTWDANRAQPLSVAEPAVYALEWKQAQSIRGMAIKEIDGAVTEVDVFNGAPGQAVDIESAEGWENVATYQQPLRNYYAGDASWNPDARYLDGYVDFGREVSTRAVRLRVIKQWDTKAHYPSGVRSDLGGQTLDLKRCRVYGIAPLKYLGGESHVDAKITERLEVIDGTSGQVVQELPLPDVGTKSGERALGNALAFNARGELLALAANKLVRVELPGGQMRDMATDLVEPSTLACGADGQIYIFDRAKDRKNIRVYDANGKFTRTIGTPGGYRRGAWDPNRLENVTGLTVDAQNQVWAVDSLYWPKRVSLWNKDGQFLKEFLGPTEYGGGGCLDPGDKRRLFYGPLEFELDWATGKTRLKNLTSLNGADTGDVPRRVNGRLYLVNTKPTNNPNFGLVYLHDGDHARLVAAVGIAGYCKPLLDPKLVKPFGGKTLIDYQCAWSDLNGDEQAQPEEVQLWPKTKGNTPVVFDNQLGAQIGPVGFRVKEWLPNGVPVYERIESPEVWTGMTLRLDNGNFYHVENNEHAMACAALRPDGKSLWTYKTEGFGGQALTKASPLHDGQIVCQIGLAGHATSHAGDLGEFMVFNTNVGIFNIMTADGMFAGQIFRDIRDRQARPWSRPDTARGMTLNEITPGQEHFNGYFCRTADNRYYAVVGHNHASVVEVVGMDRFKRFEGTIEVTGSQIAATQEWERERQTRQVYARAPVIDCYRLAAPPKLDGQLNDWPFVSAELDSNAKFRIGYDQENLYLAYEIARRGPLKNQGQQWDRLFKTGASVDLQIGTDPAAPADRKVPVAGDARLLMTFTGKEPAAVLYQAVVPGTPQDKTWHVVSPVGSCSFDRVTQLEKPRLVTSGGDDRYVVEAAIPLAALGLKIVPDLRLKLDWGVLSSGPDGTEVLRREYWSNKATQITSDAPSEAELRPLLWGHVRFHTETANSHLDPTAAKQDKTLSDLLNDLK